MAGALSVRQQFSVSRCECFVSFESTTSLGGGATDRRTLSGVDWPPCFVTSNASFFSENTLPMPKKNKKGVQATSFIFPPATAGMWTVLSYEQSEQWLVAAANRYFKKLKRNGGWNDARANSLFTVDCGEVVDFPGFLCALGEAVNGPGGYFGVDATREWRGLAAVGTALAMGRRHRKRRGFGLWIARPGPSQRAAPRGEMRVVRGDRGATRAGRGPVEGGRDRAEEMAGPVGFPTLTLRGRRGRTWRGSPTRRSSSANRRRPTRCAS